MFIYRFFSTAGFRYSLVVFLLSWLSVVSAAESQKKPIDIKAGLLSSSLNQLASQTEVSIVVNTDLVKNKSAKAIKGFYTPQNALEMLLDGHKLQAENTGTGFVIKAVSEGEVVLSAIDINAEKVKKSLQTEKYAGGQVAKQGRVGILGNRDVMDTPFNMTNFTSDFIDNTQAETIADVISTDPSVRTAHVSGGMLDSFRIRGFAMNEGNSGDIAFDGVYGVASNYRVLADYVDRIEVIKGPASMIYGMSPDSSVGGSINIVPKRALDEDLTRFTASYASDSQLKGHLDLSRRFGDDEQFGFRFNGTVSDGHTERENQSREVESWALALDYQGEKLRMTADLIHQKEDLDAPLRHLWLASGVDVPSAPDGEHNITQDWEWSKVDDKSLLLKAEYDIHDQLTFFADIGGGKTRVSRLFGYPSITNASGDVTVTPSNADFNVDRYTASTGLRGWFDTGAINHNMTVQLTEYRDQLEKATINASSSYLNNLYSPTDQAEIVVANPHNAPRVSESRLTGIALADTLSVLDDRVQLTVGVRRQQVESDSFNASTGAVTTHYNESALTPMVGVVIKPWENVSFYANRSEGLSKGDIAPDSSANAGEVFKPYKTKQYEVGAKVDFGEFTSTVSLFQIEKPSYQTVNNISSVSGEQRNRGIEMNVFGQLTPDIRLLGGLMLLDAELNKTNNPATQGNTPVGVAERQANISAEWDIPMVPALTWTANLIYTGEQYVNQANTQKIPSWTRLDLGARYGLLVAGKDVTVRAGIHNVFDRDYWSGVDTWSGMAYGAPRTFTISTSIDF